MTKKDFKLIESTIMKNNLYRELDFVEVDFDKMQITGTDMRRAVRFNLREEEVERCHGVVFTHISVISAIAKLMEKGEEYVFRENCVVINEVKISLDTVANDTMNIDKFKWLDRILTRDADKQIKVDDISFLDFDTAVNGAYVNSDYLKKVQEFLEADYYKVEIKEQKDKEVGKVKVLGYKDNDLRCEYVIQGVEYKKKIPTLF